jgi:hypothetical protein
MKLHRSLFGLAVLLAAGLGVLGQDIAVSTQMGLFNSLTTASGIVFGVMGAWVALLFPGALSAAIGGDPDSSARTKRIQDYTKPMKWAALAFAASIVFGPCAEAAKTVEALLPYQRRLLGGSFAVLTFLTATMLWSLALSLVPMLHIRDDLKTPTRQRAAIASFKSRASG